VPLFSLDGELESVLDLGFGSSVPLFSLDGELESVLDLGFGSSVPSVPLTLCAMHVTV
jgi:16S rRNA G527 N7-methylase RsmG